MNTTPTALEAAFRDAVARRLADLACAIDYPPLPDWMREFDRLAEFEAAIPPSAHTNNENIP